MRRIYIIGTLIVIYFLFSGTYKQGLKIWYGSSTITPIKIENEPFQEMLEKPISKIVSRSGGNYEITLLARYEIHGLVIQSSVYRLFYNNPFYDTDVALIWGRSKDSLKKLLSKLTIFQQGRWVFWLPKAPISEDESLFLSAHISNNHLIPSEESSTLSKMLRLIREGDEIKIRGYLASVKSPSGELVVQSSLKRDDSGDGACEVVWTEELQIGHRIFR